MSHTGGIIGLSHPRNAPVHKFGSNGDIDTATVPEDIWTAGGAYPFPAAAAATNIISSSVADDGDPVGTGAHTVTIVGLDTNFLPITETATLNGTTQVVLTNQFRRINRAWINASGSGGTNAGTIDIRHTATIIGQIAISQGQTEMAIYTVPADTRGALLHQFEFIVAKAPAATDTADIQLEVRPLGGSFRVQHTVRVRVDNGQYILPLPLPTYIPPQADVRVRAVASSANDTTVDASFDLELIAEQARHIGQSLILM